MCVGTTADPSLGSQPTSDIGHKSGSRLPLLCARPSVTFPATDHHYPLVNTKLYSLRIVTYRMCLKLKAKQLAESH